jgi:hypothetical protein
MDFMPEGPSIVILKEEANRFLGKTIVRVEGNTTIAKERLVGQRVEAIRSWGKHFLLFGSYRINQRKEAPPRLGLGFDTGALNFYACSVRFIELKKHWLAHTRRIWERRSGAVFSASAVSCGTSEGTVLAGGVLSSGP